MHKGMYDILKIQRNHDEIPEVLSLYFGFLMRKGAVVLTKAAGRHPAEQRAWLFNSLEVALDRC